MAVAPGTRIAQYVVEAPIGRGGMATVWRVRHAELGTPFALKLLHDAHAEVRERLLAEGRMQAALQHPNVVRVVDVVVHEGCPGLVLEYVDGPTLEALIDAGPIPAEVRDALVTGILHGVRAAHHAGFVHRDLKPANVLLARADDRLLPKVTDFGLARTLAAASEEGRRTRPGTLMGTPFYMAPEQMRSARDADVRSDVFALGAMLYELVTGRVPVPATDLVRLLSGLERRRYPRASVLVPDLAPCQDDAIWAALEPDPGQRIPDCSTLLAAWRGQVRFTGAAAEPTTEHPFDDAYLAKVMALTPDRVSLSSAAARGPRAVGSRPRKVALAVGIAAGLGALAGLAWWTTPDAGPAPASPASASPASASPDPAPVATRSGR